MLRIERSEDGQGVRVMLSGQIEAEHLAELRRVIDGGDRQRPVALDLREVMLVDRDVVMFFAACELGGATLENCPPYVREWITRERAETESPPRRTRPRRNPKS